MKMVWCPFQNQELGEVISKEEMEKLLIKFERDNHFSNCLSVFLKYEKTQAGAATNHDWHIDCESEFTGATCNCHKCLICIDGKYDRENILGMMYLGAKRTKRGNILHK